MHPISSPPFYIWLNRERHGPQTELWEWVQQQCGQDVNTQTWRGRAASKAVLISSGLSRRADRGWGGGSDLGSFYSLLARQTTSLLPAALSFGLSGLNNRRSSIDRSSTMKQKTDKQADKCTWRLKSGKTAETHQFVNSTIFKTVVA